MTNILITGVGGQGIVLASKLLAGAAMKKGLPVMSAETIGMAQKGGSVQSYLRIGRGAETAMFPRGTADLLLSFEPAEAVRMLPFLKKGGTAIVNTHAIMPTTASLSGASYSGREMTDYLEKTVENLVLVDGDAACKSLGSPRALNMVLLGAALRSGALPFTVDEVDEVMRSTVRENFRDLNSRALRYTAPEH